MEKTGNPEHTKPENSDVSDDSEGTDIWVPFPVPPPRRPVPAPRRSLLVEPQILDDHMDHNAPVGMDGEALADNSATGGSEDESISLLSVAGENLHEAEDPVVPVPPIDVEERLPEEVSSGSEDQTPPRIPQHTRHPRLAIIQTHVMQQRADHYKVERQNAFLRQCLQAILDSQT